MKPGVKLGVTRHLAVALALFAGPAMAEAPKPPADPPGVVEMTPEQQKTTHLQLARAERRPITEPVRVAGSVAFDPGHVALLRPFEQAQVTRILVQPGEAVAAGQKLAELNMPGLTTAEQSLTAAQASVREAAAGVAVARDALRRGVMLARDGSLAVAEAQRRRLVLAQAVAAADTANAQAASMKQQVSRLNPIASPGGSPGVGSLVTPIGGVVASVGITPGEVVDASREAFMVADLSVVMVMAQVPEASAGLVAVGDPARVTAGGRQWDGRVATLGAALDPQARTLPARIQLPNPDGALRAGMFVNVTITSPLGRDAVVVPSAAVQLVADKRVVFTPLDGGRFQSREVSVGVERPDWVEIRSGLAAGDQVATEGSFALKALLLQSLLGGG